MHRSGHIGHRYEFFVQCWKNEKYLARYVSKEWWSRLIATYQDPLHTKEALEIMMTLFEEVAAQVAEKLAFSYDAQEFSTVRCYVMDVLKR